MKLLIHDVEQDGGMHLSEDEYCILPANGPGAPCLGCFGCWLKTPAKCVLKDRLKDMGALLASVDEFIIVSASQFGALSPQIKKILDRSISYLLPFFKMVNKEMHHAVRYPQQFKLSVYLHNEDEISAYEKEILEQYIHAMAINLNACQVQIAYAKNIGEVML